MFYRANVFLLGGGGALFSTLAAPTVASFLMAKSAMLSLYVGLSMIILGASIIVFMPETLHLRLSEATGTLVKVTSTERPDIYTTGKSNDKESRSFKSKVTEFLCRTYEATKVIRSIPIMILLLTFLASPFGSQSVGLSIRYISNRFSWKLRETMLLLSLRALVNILVLLAFIPLLSTFLIKKMGFSSKGKDLLLARFSIIVLAIGSFVIAASPTIGLTIFGMIIWTVGTGYESLTRSLITTLVDKEHIGRLYSIITVVETVGALIAGPTLNWLYSVGLKKGGGWIGLPFYFLTLVCLVASLGTWSYGLYGSNRKKDHYYEPVPFGEEYLDNLESVEGSREDLVLLEADVADRVV